MALHTGSVGPPIRADTMEPEVFRQLIAIHGGMSFTSGPPSGIIGSGDFPVTQNGTPNMSVNVGPGFAIVGGTNNTPVQGAYNTYNDAAVNVVVPASNPTNPRIDLICLTIQDAYYSGASNTAIFQDIAGTPAASPGVPATPANSIVLAHIYVGANASTITNSAINTTSFTNNPDHIAFVPPIFPPGVLGYAQSTTAQGSIGNNTNLTGLSVNVNINAGRRLRITGFVVYNNTTTGLTVVNILRTNNAGTVTQIGQAAQTENLAGGDLYADPLAIDQGLAAGVYTYNLQYGTAGGVGNTLSTATVPAFILVEDIGPAA